MERWKVFPGRTTRNTHWQWLTGSVSTARSNSGKRSGKLLWHLNRKTVGKGLRDGADGLDEQETQQYRSLVGTALCVGEDRPETQYATKEAARFMSGPTRVARCMLKRLCKYCSEAPKKCQVRSGRSQMRIGQGNWRDCARRRVDGFTLVIICWRRIRRHSRYISSTKGAAHALEVRSAMVEYGMTFNVVCETDASGGLAMATRSGVGRVRHLDARLL